MTGDRSNQLSYGPLTRRCVNDYGGVSVKIQALGFKVDSSLFGDRFPADGGGDFYLDVSWVAGEGEISVKLGRGSKGAVGLRRGAITFTIGRARLLVAMTLHLKRSVSADCGRGGSDFPGDGKRLSRTDGSGQIHKGKGGF